MFFGASDQPMTRRDARESAGPILHFPTVLGAVVPVYNLEGVSTQIKFTGPVLADIFLGKITKWNDPAIAKINAGVSLPSSDITVVHRSDGSGTTFVWADYLSKISPEWKQKVGANSSLNWPVGVGGKGNEGVAGLVSQTPGSLGYVELVYALQNKISYGAVQNQAGEFVDPRRQIGHGRRRRRHADDAERLPRVDHELARCRARIPSRRSPGFCCTKIREDKTSGAGHERLHEVGARRRTDDGRRRSATRGCPSARAAWSSNS